MKQTKTKEGMMLTECGQHVAERWTEEQMFEEDVRAVMLMLRPHRRERMQGWQEYRTGGKHYRVTISWDQHFARSAENDLTVPAMAEVLETILVGSARNQDELTPAEEFEMYRRIVQELRERLDSLQACYE